MSVVENEVRAAMRMARHNALRTPMLEMIEDVQTLQASTYADAKMRAAEVLEAHIMAVTCKILELGKDAKGSERDLIKSVLAIVRGGSGK